MSRLAALLGERVRRDAVQIGLWAAGIAALGLASVSGVASTFDSEQERAVLLATAIANPVVLLFRGLPSGVDEGSFIAFLIVPWLALLAALMTGFLAVRHTRAEEESGRAELVGATPAGRVLPTVATIVHGAGASVLAGAFAAAALIVGGLDAYGSVITGAATAGVGVVFLGVALVAAQLFRSPRGANGATVAVLLTTFVLAGIGNALGRPSDDLQRIDSSWLTWVSPIGWAESTRPYDENAWGPVVLCVVVGASLAAASLVLQSLRDGGASFLAARQGRADAAASLSTTAALVARLTAGSVLAWAVGAAFAGALSTSLASVIEQVGEQNAAIDDIIARIAGSGDDLARGVMTTFFTMIGIFAACCAVQTVIRARQDEAHGTAELVLATPVNRVRWLAGYVVVGALAGVIVLAAAVAAAWLGIAASGAGESLYGDVAVAALGQALTAGAFVAVTALVFVLAPRLTIALGWTLVLVAGVVALFGPILGLSEDVTHLSPFGAAPVPSSGGVDLRGAWWLAVVIAAGTAAALAGMRRRELAPA